jgi:hypothetical protein|eukprot:COSAG01_NODE_4995_length_4559_cov_6.424439_7_plen_91_part_00
MPPEQQGGGSACCLQHPYGVRPWGNYLADLQRSPGGVALCRAPGLGRLHVLGDELLLRLLGWLGAPDLGALAPVSRVSVIRAHSTTFHTP